MKSKKIISLLLAASVAASMGLAGCGSVNPTAVGATYGDKEISLGYMNFVAHYMQYNYDTFFASYYGEGYWTDENLADDDGVLMQDSVKQDIADEICLEYEMETHMAEYGVEITEQEAADMKAAAEQFMEDNSKEAIKAMGATAEYVEQMLYYQTIAFKMEAAIREDIDTEVSEEEMARGTFSYVEIPKMTTDEDGVVDVLSTDEELGALVLDAEMILEAATADQAAEEVVEEEVDALAETEEVEEAEEDTEAVEEDADVADEDAEVLDGSETTQIIDEENGIMAISEEDGEAVEEADPFEAAATAYGYTLSRGSFNPYQDPAENAEFPEDLLKVVYELEDGEYADIVETEGAYYVVRLNAANDATATEGAKITILGDRAEERYTEVTEGYMEAAPFELNEKEWKKVKFDKLFVTPVVEEPEVTE